MGSRTGRGSSTASSGEITFVRLGRRGARPRTSKASVTHQVRRAVASRHYIHVSAHRPCGMKGIAIKLAPPTTGGRASRRDGFRSAAAAPLRKRPEPELANSRGSAAREKPPPREAGAAARPERTHKGQTPPRSNGRAQAQSPVEIFKPATQPEARRDRRGLNGPMPSSSRSSGLGSIPPRKSADFTLRRPPRWRRAALHQQLLKTHRFMSVIHRAPDLTRHDEMCTYAR